MRDFKVDVFEIVDPSAAHHNVFIGRCRHGFGKDSNPRSELVHRADSKPGKIAENLYYIPSSDWISQGRCSGLLDDLSDNGGNLFSSPWLLKTFCQFGILVSFCQAFEKRDRMFAWPLVRNVQLKPIYNLSRTSKTLSFLIADVSLKELLHEQHHFHHVEAIHCFGNQSSPPRGVQGSYCIESA